MRYGKMTVDGEWVAVQERVSLTIPTLTEETKENHENLLAN
jgi:hypothetical protein